MINTARGITFLKGMDSPEKNPLKRRSRSNVAHVCKVKKI
jgi:hypothetical protein